MTLAGATMVRSLRCTRKGRNDLGRKERIAAREEDAGVWVNRGRKWQEREAITGTVVVQKTSYERNV